MVADVWRFRFSYRWRPAGAFDPGDRGLLSLFTGGRAGGVAQSHPASFCL